MIWRRLSLVVAPLVVVACATHTDRGTLADLRQIEAQVEEVPLEDSLDRAAQSYRRFLEETSGSTMTPEAMRRHADQQIEKEYGRIGDGILRREGLVLLILYVLP